MATKTSGEGAKRGRPRKGPDPDRFQEIVDSAAQIILDKGYSATSIQDIADAVGILKGSLYHYVRSKEDFLYQIIKDVYDEALADIARVAAMDAPALDRLAAFIHAHVVFAAEHLTAYTIQIREFDRLSDERRAEIREGGDSYVEVLEGILDAGQRSGEIDPNFTPRLGSVILIGALNSMTQWYRPGGSLKPEQVAEAYSSLIVSAVASDASVTDKGGIEKLRAVFQGIVPAV